MGGGDQTYDYGFRIYNPGLAKFLSVDPLSASYPWYTPYQFAGNKPIWAIDLDGLEEYFVTDYYDATGALYKTTITLVTAFGMSVQGNKKSEQIIHRSRVDVQPGNTTYRRTFVSSIIQVSTGALGTGAGMTFRSELERSMATGMNRDGTPFDIYIPNPGTVFTQNTTNPVTGVVNTTIVIPNRYSLNPTAVGNNECVYYECYYDVANNLLGQIPTKQVQVVIDSSNDPTYVGTAPDGYIPSNENAVDENQSAPSRNGIGSSGIDGAKGSAPVVLPIQ
jgi:hypothetical protein